MGTNHRTKTSWICYTLTMATQKTNQNTASFKKSTLSGNEFVPATTNNTPSNWLLRLLDPRNQSGNGVIANSTFGGGVNNALNDIKSGITGILGLPGRVIQDVQNPQQAGNDVVSLITNTASGINKAVGAPVATKNGQITGLQAPSAYEAAQTFYKNPVTDLLNLDVAGGLAKGALTKSGITTAAEETAPKTVTESIPGGNAKDIPADVTQQFKSRYTVPDKRIADLKPMQTSQEILAHIKGGMNPEILDQAPGLITGDNGIVTQMTRDTLNNIKGDIKVGGEASKQAENILNATDNKMFTTPAEKQAIVNHILSGEEAGGTPLTMDPLSAFDYQRQLESIASKYDFSANNYLNPYRMGDAAKADAYHAAANAVSDEINKTVGDQGILDSIKTPERIQTLEKISPRLAQQVKDAKDLSDLRHTAAPFVKLSKMQQLTQEGGNSVFGKVGKALSTPEVQPANAILSTLGAKVGGFPGYAAGRAAGNVLDRVFAPEINSAMNKIEEPLQNSMLQRRLGNTTGKGLPILSSIINAPYGAGLKVLFNSNNNNINAGQEGNSENDINHGQSISPNDSLSSGRYNFGNPYANGALLPDSTKQQITKLQSEATATKISDPIKANQIAAQAQALQGQYDAQNNLRIAYNGNGSTPGVAQLEQYGNETYNSVQQADPTLLNYLSKGYDSLQKASNGKYSAMATNLQALSSATGIDFTKAANKDALLSSIDSAMKLVKDQWDIAQQAFSGQPITPVQQNTNPVLQSITTRGPSVSTNTGGVFRSPVDLNSTNGMENFNFQGKTPNITGNSVLDQIITGNQ